MKVIYVINQAVPYGANVALLNVLDGVVEFGVVPLVVMGETGVLCNELERRKIRYEIVKQYFAVYPSLRSFRDYVLFVPRYLRTYLTNKSAVKKLIRIAKEFNPDLIHTNISPTHFGEAAARLLGIPHVWHIREYQDLYYRMHPIPSMKAFMKKLNGTNTFPIAITNDLLKHYQVGKNGQVIYDGVRNYSDVQFNPLKEKYFLFVGRLEKSKGIAILLKIFIEFAQSRPEYVLIIAGSGKEDFLVELNEIVNNSGVSKQVQFLGFRNDINDLMSKATALIVSSNHEGFGFITAEAMFNGCLVIGNRSGGTQEILENEDLGILYSNEEELLTALETVVENNIESYFFKIKKAQDRARVLYSREQNIEQILNLYTKILNK